MDLGGEPESRREYIMGESTPYNRNTPESIGVGEHTSFNDLWVKNNSNIASQNLVVGSESTSQYNQVVIHDQSTWNTVGAYVGHQGGNNTLVLVGGSSFTSDLAVVGFYSSHNSVYLGMENTVWHNTQTFVVGANGSNNYMRINNKGRLEVEGNAIIGGGTSSDHNEVNILDAHTVWTNSSLEIGYLEASNNVLRITQKALVTVDDELKIGDGLTGLNYLSIYDGFFAWKGERYEELVDLMLQCKIRIGDSLMYSSEGDEYFSLMYVETDEMGLYFTGGLYDGLAGYTILTAIPEPATYALLILGALGVLLLRKKVIQKRQ